MKKNDEQQNEGLIQFGDGSLLTVSRLRTKGVSLFLNQIMSYFHLFLRLLNNFDSIKFHY